MHVDVQLSGVVSFVLCCGVPYLAVMGVWAAFNMRRKERYSLLALKRLEEDHPFAVDHASDRLHRAALWLAAILMVAIVLVGLAIVAYGVLGGGRLLASTQGAWILFLTAGLAGGLTTIVFLVIYVLLFKKYFGPRRK